ncbi:hypothetical protein BAE44_0005724 [Dichanthelium oligosanthes]|uniref:RNase H type-1 domain-containing protein n=1 Tax=Dichanthelium oligosanthes TaxID=888268 RepID=A0A1E5W7C0_9POAL|nr:hypothetical protein BAE44_0005724 [Dichanthelium oligosanthes]
MLRWLQIARELGLDRVVAEGDELVLVQLLRGEDTQTRIPMQEEILGVLRCPLGCDVWHVYREGNHVAHTVPAGVPRPGDLVRRWTAERRVGEERGR